MSKKKEETIGDRVSRLREEAKIDRITLACLSGVSVNAIQLIERGATKTPNKETVKRLARALDVRTEELTG